MNESKKLALKIRETVWDPVRKKLGDCKKIYISPVNFLANVPWAGLPGSEKGRYLVHEFTFVHGDDPISILEAKALQPFREKPRFVLMGGIDYGPADTAAGLSWSALNGSQSEIAGIQSHLKSADCRLISGQTGSESELLRQLKDASRPLFLHLAVHGFALESERYTTPSTELSELSFRQSKLPILERHPFSMTGVVLAGANRSFSVDVPYGEDGYFSGESLIGLDLGHVEMVVLSACDSGRGQVALGEGTFGIRKPLRIAGVRTVVSSLWKAHDDVTRQLMVEFYKNLVNGKSKAESLQLAQVALAAKYPPALWASWQIDGDSR